MFLVQITFGSDGGDSQRRETLRDSADDDVPKRFPAWRRSSSFYLFTHAFDDASPVCCGDSGEPIPVYLLPIPDQDRRDLFSWAGSYKHLDNIWLNSGALEIPAYKQLADPTSQLSVAGRELCASIEKATQKLTFYYLKRYWGRSDGEATRVCPLCGRKWRLSNQPADMSPLHKFQFKCDSCRLVSRIADSYDDERHARIGEYKRRKDSVLITAGRKTRNVNSSPFVSPV